MSRAIPKRAALYLRVSTDVQTMDNQRPDMERLARARGYRVVAVYEEHESAAKRRPTHARMLDDARRGVFDVLVVWALDRFGRSMASNVRQVLELDHLGVLVVSVREPWLDTSGPVRDLLVAIFSWVAEQERSRLVERTKAGLARARREGKRLGRRHRMVGYEVDRALAMRAEGRSVRGIAMALKVPRSTLARVLSQKRVAPRSSKTAGD
jgi:putative DNA-invertase from lambdoid prophage Rac